MNRVLVLLGLDVLSVGFFVSALLLTVWHQWERSSLLVSMMLVLIGGSVFFGLLLDGRTVPAPYVGGFLWAVMVIAGRRWLDNRRRFS